MAAITKRGPKSFQARVRRKGILPSPVRSTRGLKLNAGRERRLETDERDCFKQSLRKTRNRIFNVCHDQP